MPSLWSQAITTLRRTIDPDSMQTRLTTGVVLTSLVGLGSMAAWMGWRMQQILLDSHRQRTALVADRFEEDVRYYTTMMPPDAALQKVIDYRTSGDLAIWVKSGEGDVVAWSETLDMGSWRNAGITPQLLEGSIPRGLTIVPIQDWHLVVCSQAMTLKAWPNSTLYIADDITANYRSMERLMRTLLFTTLLIVSLLAIAVAFYIRRALRPIRQLNRNASEVTADTLAHHQLDPDPAPRELQELVRTYNLMLRRLSTAWEQQKRFVNDMSHELRTPLSLVQGYLESTLRRSSNLTAPQREGLEVAAAETNRTVRLLEQLLDLARLDSGQMPLTLTPVDLEEVVQAAVSMAEADYLQSLTAVSRITVEAPAQPLIAKADEDKLRTVLIELLDNALRYSGSSSPIQVRLQQQDGWAMIQVKDHGPGIPLTCQHNIFNPFYRVDENRSRSTGGTGLGLTLVRSRVEAMAGYVSLQSKPGQGCIFAICLPL
jgi:signal transduction histidine kinase